MQRDAYAVLIRHRNKKIIQANILQVSEVVTRENLIDEVFVGYMKRRLVLMTHIALQDPKLPHPEHDIIVPDFNSFAKFHQPHYVYKLLPLMCANIETFSAMQSICASPGCPFTIDDRRDPQGLRLRLPNGCASRDAICEFFKPQISVAEWRQPASTRKLPISGIQFSGVMLKTGKLIRKGSDRGDAQPESSSSSSTSTTTKPSLVSTAALLSTYDHLSEQVIHTRALERDFFESQVYDSIMGNNEAYLSVKTIRDQKHFMAITRTTGIDSRARRSLLKLAAEKKLFVYEKCPDGAYRFATA